MSPSYTEKQVSLAVVRRPDRPSRIELNPETLGELADDMAANGLLQRVGLRGPFPDGTYEIGWGDRRTAAARLLGWTEIDAKVFPVDTPILTMRAAENLQREQLSPIEEGLMVQELTTEGMALVEIARRFRRSIAWVEQRLALLDLPTELRDAVHRGELALNVATALAQVDHDDYRASLVREAQNSGASVRVVNVWVAHYQADRDRIVKNHLTVQEITAARGAYVIYYNCDGCGQEVPYDQTVSWRFCAQCGADLRDAGAGQHNGRGPGEGVHARTEPA